ncbi:MAG: hypothetical protein EBU00_08900 [Alphaproteobacteria bacterium]|nr:hypothetical protein [Alphaproteobacteria bacterium]
MPGLRLGRDPEACKGCTAVKLSHLALFATLAFSGALLSGCATATDKTKMAAATPASTTAATAAPVETGAIRGIGYAAISIQPGRTRVQKQLMAIRASRLMAMRELAEKIYGLDVNSYASLSEGVMQADTLRGTVAGIVRSARTVSIGPIKSDIYETILEIDASDAASMVAQGAPKYK